MKKGELSMEVIVIAAIAVLVLVILTILVVNGTIPLTKQTKCEGMRGTCSADACGEGFTNAEYVCEEGLRCCIPVT